MGCRKWTGESYREWTIVPLRKYYWPLLVFTLCAVAQTTLRQFCISDEDDSEATMYDTAQQRVSFAGSYHHYGNMTP